MESNILIALILRVLEWVISFFKRIKSASVLQKAASTEKNTEIHVFHIRFHVLLQKNCVNAIRLNPCRNEREDG